MVALDKIEVPSAHKDCICSENSYQSVDTKNNKNSHYSCCEPPGVTQNCEKGAVVKNGHEKKKNVLVQYFKKTKEGAWSPYQFTVIVVLAIVEFLAAAVISIQGPFYPDVASSKGASNTEIGLVFGIFEITVFLVSPLYGAKMDQLKPRRVFNWGILTTGICCVVFGLLDTIEGRGPFIWSCLIVRTIEAMGDAAFDTASFTIIAMEFPDSVATSFSILEICFGVGLIIGPTLGGVLYEIGGYRLPFLAMGGLLFLSAIATYFFLPEPSEIRQKKNAPHKDSGSVVAENAHHEIPAQPIVRGGFHMFKMLKIPVIAMTAYSIVAATAGVGFISANLDVHLDQFNLNKIAVGAVFVMNGGVYALTAPVWGWICDHTDYQKAITFTGAIFTILGFIFIGPIPGFPIDTTLPVSCMGLALFGFGLAATLVSAFLQVLNDAIAHGYPDDISTYGLVSGLWTSMSALGYFIGPSVGGFAVDLVGFRWSSTFIIAGQLVLIIMLCGYYFSRGNRIFHISQLEDEAKGSSPSMEDAKNHNNLTSSNVIGVPCSVNVVSDNVVDRGPPSKRIICCASNEIEC